MTTDIHIAQNRQSLPVVFSAMQPSGELTIGNYIGALRHWVALQEHHNCFFSVVNQHAITVRQTPADLRKWTLDVAALYLAAGISPEKAAVFVQSQVPEHAQLSWVLNCYTMFGECNKMTQFKDKSRSHADNINVGLFTYPVLMAADILLYGTNFVPVGDDQKQHLELTRNIAERMNHYYPNVFVVPEPLIMPVGARLASLQEPTRKMSKSDPNQKATIFLLDKPDIIRSKLRKAVTDSDGEIRFTESRPAISNLLTLFHVAANEPIETLEQRYQGKGYGVFKDDLAEAVVAMLTPIQERFLEIRNDKERLSTILEQGAEQARKQAQRTLRTVYKKIGLSER